MKKLIRREKHKWIAELVPNKSFIDIGGLWGTVNETVTLAAKAGARSYTMADIAPVGAPMWQAFDKRCEEIGVSGYESRTIDICDEAQVDAFPSYDVVHCSGIMYHVSDPIQFIQNVAKVTNEHLIISSMTVPEVIREGFFNKLESPIGTAHSVPAMSSKNRQLVKNFYARQGLDSSVVDILPYEELFLPNRRVNTGPWWWLYTIDTLAAMCEVCGLDVVKKHCSPNGAFSSVLCRIP